MSPPVPEATGVPFGTRLSQVAAEKSDEVAVTFLAEAGGVREVTWGEMEGRANQLARAFAGQGLSHGDHLAVCLENSPEHLMACFAGWKLGAVPIPMRWGLPRWELDRLLGVIEPGLVVDATDTVASLGRSAPSGPLPEIVAPHSWGVCSSGSTGAPKVVVLEAPGLFDPALPNTSAVVESYGPLPRPQVVMVPAPLYHTNGMTAARNVMAGDRVVLLERFRAEGALEAIGRQGVTGFIAASPMLQRMAQVEGVEDADLSTLDWVQQGAAPLPVWLGRIWADLVGPERFYLSYGASEAIGLVVCRGDEWLEHPGTLGRGYGDTEIRVLGASGEDVPPGEVGEIYLRTSLGPAARYVGADVAPLAANAEGFATVGDLGWLDEDGYLYLADRRVDLIVTGGANVYPAEVEAALSEHPGIADVVVIGLHDPTWGRRVHAVVQPAVSDRAHLAPLGARQVIDFARSRLAPYKVPKSVEFVDALPRTEAMKLNRAALTAEREGR